MYSTLNVLQCILKLKRDKETGEMGYSVKELGSGHVVLVKIMSLKELSFQNQTKVLFF